MLTSLKWLRVPACCPVTMVLVLLIMFLMCGLAMTSDSQLRFTQSSYNVSIPENSVRNSLVTTEEMVGIFSGETNTSVIYRVVSGDSGQLFSVRERYVGGFWFLVISSRSGSLNRERKDKYDLIVNATVIKDQKAFETTTSVTVHIIDINDLSPLFYSQEYSTSIPEDLSVHSSILKVYAEDADLGRNGEVYYSFEDISEHFSIHPVTGVVSLMRPLKYSEKSVYDLKVLAQDRGVSVRGNRKPSSKAAVQVIVTQVNLHGPEVYVYHLPEIAEYSHADVYAIVRVTDRDEGVNGQILSLEIVEGDEDGHFRITRVDNPTAGVKGEEFNIEMLKLVNKSTTNNGYNLTLRAVDKGIPARTTYVSIPIKIKDNIYSKPIFEREIYEIDVTENTPVNSSIIRLKILDQNSLDSSQVLLEIVGGNEAGEFRVNPVTGVLYTAVPLDAELKTFYTLTVSAIDHGSIRSVKQSSAKVKIQVIDSNDNDPVFDNPFMDLWINENEPAGTFTAKVTAKDRDSGENAYISYSVANLNSVPFEIDHFSGVVRTTKVLDYESMRREYTLFIRASDWGTPFRRQSEMRLKIRVKDINDNKPLFEKTDCVGHLPRKVPLDTEVITLSAIDLDAGNIISYKIASGNEEGCFSLDVTSGMLSVACDLSKLNSLDIHINVTAYDGTHFADFAQVFIKLIDSDQPRDFLVNGESASFVCKDLGVAKRLTEVLALAEKHNGLKSKEEDEVTLPNRYGVNSHPPQIISMPLEIQINESVPLGYVIMTVKAVDKDLGYNGKLIFGILSGDVDSTFTVGQETGDLRVSGYLDREYRDRYFLNISVFDLGQPRLISSRILSIVVLDVNDNAPVFDRSVVSFKIKENTPGGTEIVQFKATDVDLGENAHVWYKLVTDTDSFNIDSRSGMLTVGKTLDREQHSTFELKVRASDRASDPNDPDALHSYALARVIVGDLNDEVPVFPSQAFLVKIREDVPVGTLVVTVDAWDPDLDLGGEVRYSFSQPVEGLPFRVDEETGAVRTTASLDYEERQVYSVLLRGDDLGVPTLWSEVNLTIEITDVNENIYPPRFDDFVYSAKVSENLPPETLVMTLTATDADPPGEDSTVSYLIVAGSGLGYFTIDEQGNIWTEAVLDRETTPHYWLTVHAYDHGVAPLFSRVEVFIEVEDVNDNAPLTSQPSYTTHISENSPSLSPVLRIAATDIDQQPGPGLSFAISAGNSAGHFDIDQTGLIYTTTDQIDRETQEEYVLEVTVSDNGRPPLSSTAQVVIIIEDENDNSPQFDQTFYHIMIPEVHHKDSTFIIQNEVDASDSDLEFEALFIDETWRSLDTDNLTGYPVFRLLAVDSDTEANGRVEYEVKSSHGRFTIHPQSGTVFAQRPALANHDFDLLVRASDHGTPRRRATVRVSVHVMGWQGSNHPSNLQAPIPLRVHVTEQDLPGYLVALIQPPSADSNLIWFSIVDGDPRDEFIIGVDSGSVQLAQQLDCETQDFYNLTISISDNHRTVYTQLEVEVIDSNEFRPEFTKSEYLVSVAESAAQGAQLVELSATDRDASSQLVYSMHGAQSMASLELFNLDHQTGLLTLSQPLDRETNAKHILTVVVSDSSSPVKRDFARVIVQVTDSNDHAPQWSGGVVQADVLESAFIGSRVVTVKASDKDHGKNAAVTYAIVSGNIGNFFAIDEVSGDISVSRELDCEVVAEFNLMVRVVDGGSPPLASTLPVFITVRQSDHSPPRFEAHNAVAEVAEDAPLGSLVWQVRARSALAVTYRIESGNTGEHFTINPTTGAVVISHFLDYETIPIYNLTISATNLAGVRSESSLIVDVVDCNDNAPVFLETEYRGRLPEDAAPGSLVLTSTGSPLVLKAYDKDSAILQYEITETVPQRMFYIDTSTGALRTRGGLDYEQTQVVTFQVQVRDQGNPQLSARNLAKVTVDVVDVNDCPPRFSQAEYYTMLLLPTFNNATIIQVDASDCDSPNITKLEYSIVTGNYDNIYLISGDSGLITLRNKSRVVHKTPQRLKISVTDGVHTTFSFVNIKWEWSSESTLSFQQSEYETAIVENSTKIMTVAVVTVVGAELNEHILFSILNPSPLFDIAVTSGAIRTTGLRFDRELCDHYQLLVQARSEASSDFIRVAQTLVNVTVLDINDNCPVFVGVPYYGTVAVDTTRGDVISKVHAIDLDSGENGDVRYELMRGHGELFRVHRKTGEVILKQPLESQVHEYQLSIAAYDGGMTPCSTDVWVHLTVVDKSLPLFDKQFHTVSVPEDVSPHTVVPVSFHTHVPHGMKLYYTIVAGNEYETFSIDFTSGVLRVADELDFEDAHQHGLTVRATDIHTGASAETAVKVIVTDVNDCYPEFPVNIYHTAVSEAATPGTFVIKVLASDKDTGAGGVVRYSMKRIEGNNSELFIIEPEDGSVYLKRSLDREQLSVHKLVVIATDTGIPNLSTSVHLWIKVLDVNDNTPQFARSVFVFHLSMEAVRGQFVGQASAWDPDQDHLHYSIVSKSMHHMFSINPDTGIIQLIKLHSSVSASSVLELNISVSDGVHMSFCKVAVNLVSADIRGPAFLADHYEVTLPENIAESSFLELLNAEGEPGITYSIPDERYADVVTIDHYTGMLRSKKALDREKRALYEILVVASDKSGHVGFTNVHLTVTDINDNAPVFQSKEYSVCVPANLTTDSAFLKVRATDLDKGPAGQVTYTLHDSVKNDITYLFGIHPVSGALYLQQSALSLEGQTYQFFVRATDRGNPPLHADVPVKVYIMDVSDEPPAFQRTDESFLIPEDVSLGHNITQLLLSSPEPVSYQVIATNSPVSVSTNGQVYLSLPLDREQISVYTIGVLAQSQSVPVLSTLTSITLVVLDVNDNQPVFGSKLYQVAVAENVNIGTSIMKVEAEDADEGRNGEVYYRLEGGEGVFTVDTYTGWVLTSGALDRERTKSLNLTVVAVDNGSPALSTRTTLLVDLVDYNDNPPRFSKDVYTVSVKENVLEGSELLQLDAADLDSESRLKFYITEGDPDLHFAMDDTLPGVMYLRRALDREKKEGYKLTVVVSDSKYISSAQVVVEVLDVNDEQPYCVQSRYYALLAENTVPGSYVLTVDIDDSDLEPVANFHLVGDGADYFYLHRDKGELKTSKLLDRETMPKYSLKAYVYDDTFPEWECISFLEITVKDVNDNAPDFLQSTHKVSLSEDSAIGTFIAKMNAVDFDRGLNRKIRYYLVNSGENHFEVDKDTAIVRLAKPLDREAQSMFTLIVKAVDSGMPQLWTLTTLQVTVLDINDNPPEFVSRIYSVTVPENTTANTEIIKVEALSKDTGINAQVIYTIIEGNEQGIFDLHPVTGVASVVQPLDYEHTKQFILEIMATDQGIPPLSSQAMVNITVVDSNDNAPIFVQSSYAVQVSEDVSVGEIILKVEASDKDTGSNARVGYYLDQGDNFHQFSLDLNTGELLVTKTLDRESIGEYKLTARATDFGSPSLSSTVFIIVTVLDINDNPPSLTQDNYTFFVQEDKMPGWAVGQLIVSDADAFPNGAPFSFSILSGNPDLAFRVVSDGTLYTAARLSTNIRSVYYLQIRVADSGFLPLYTDSWVTVKVIEESQFAPVLSPLEVVIIAYQERWPGGEIGHLVASDQDPYDTLQFRLESTTAGLFSVETHRGILSAGPILDAGRYRLNVSVTDGKFTTHATVIVSVLPLWEEMLQHSVSIRLRTMTAHHFVLRQWRSLIRLLETALLRKVTLTSLQAVAHGDLDILLTISGGVEMAVLSDALQSAGLSGANWSCDCLNGGLCRQRVQIQRDLVFTVATDHVSFVCPGHSHQLYCACNLGFAGEHCEELLPPSECHCPPPQICVPQQSGPGYVCLPPTCPPSHSCPTTVPAAVSWEEMVAIVVAILIISCLVIVFILYRRCHRISPSNRTKKSEMNHVIKRTSKLSNLQVTQQPSRPTSYTCSSNNELFSAVTLNNVDTRNGANEIDNVPPDYRRNLMSPHHKINNDLKQTADIPMHQLLPPEEETRTIGGYHWDCSDWLQNGDIHQTNLTELPDSSSYHSNDSCQTGDPARELATLDTKLSSREEQVIPYGFPTSVDIRS